jgi:ABC-type antimicrobial peptide transport system permease subunit
MVLKNLWRRKTRTFLTLLGIAIGVAAVVALTAFSDSFISNFTQIAGTSNADLQVSQKDALMLVLSAVDDEVGDEIRQMPGVQSVAGTVVGIVQVRDSPYFLVMGEDPKGFAISRYPLIDGASITGRHQVLLGKLTAKNFNKLVGDKFGIQDVSYEVAGIYETGQSFEDGGAVIALKEAKTAFDKRNQVSFFNIKLRDPAKADDLKAAIEARWETLTAARAGHLGTVSETVQVYKSLGWFLGIFAVLVGGLGMMNTMLMSVFERTREIGVLRAVGWTRWRVIGMIIGEALVLAVIGGVIGIAMGYGVLAWAAQQPAVSNVMDDTFTLDLVVQAFATALLLGVVGGSYPAFRASQLLPAEAMRRESGVSVEMRPVTRFVVRTFGRGPLRNLVRRPVRTLITVSSLGLGVGFIVALIAIVEGFTVLFSQLGVAGQVDLMVEQAKASDASFSVIDERIADKIEMRDDVKSVSKILLGMSSAPGLPYFIVFGLDPHEQYIEHYRLVEGTPIRRPNDIMIGRTAARSLKREVGEQISLSGSRYRIAGIYENGVAFEDSGAVIALREAQRLFRKHGQVSFLGIAVNEPMRADEIAATLENEFPALMIAKVANFTERMNDMKVTYAALDMLIWITMLVGGVVMMNAMLMSVFERTQEIGVLRALGWSKLRVVRMVILEALILSVLAALIGIAFGVMLAHSFTLDPTMGAFLIPAYSMDLFARMFMLAVGLGVVSAIYPALRAAGMQPVEALRHE